MTDTGKYDWIRLLGGILVVVTGLLVLAYTLQEVVGHYPVEDEKGAVSDSSTAITAVMTPVAAAVAAIVGLYFGLSASAANKREETRRDQVQFDRGLQFAALAESGEARAPSGEDPPSGEGGKTRSSRKPAS
jgi:hypothetical protein